MIKASIDIGSNTVLLLVANVEEKITVLESLSTVTGLGRGLDTTGSFLDEAMLDTKNAIKNYLEICNKYKIQRHEILITATEASRKSKNALPFFEDLKKELNITFYILTGEGEAYYSALGVLVDEKIKDEMIFIMDIGGASTEFIQVNTAKKEILKSISLEVGAVRSLSWLENKTYKKNLDEQLKRLHQNFTQINKIICVAGTMTSVANIFLGHSDFVENEVHGMELSIEQLNEVFQKVSKMTEEELLSSFPFLGKRVKTIKAGVQMALDLLNSIKTKEIIISAYGLRYGTILAGEIKENYYERII